MNYRIVFLDVDGVLHPYPPHSLLQRMCWVPHIAELILPHPDVHVVIHSRWRYYYSVELLRQLLGEMGPRLLGVTPPGQRYESITTFLSQSAGVVDYRILDDMAEEFPEDPAPRELILCDGRTGVSALRIRAALSDWLASPISNKAIGGRAANRLPVRRLRGATVLTLNDYQALATRHSLPPAKPGKRERPGRARAAEPDRALFLDFDGVLHPTLIEADIAVDEIVVGTGLFGWLPALVSVLRTHADVALVVHSTWRRTHDIDELRGVLGALGSRVVGMTPPGRRFDSIESWLRLNPQFSSYRILDDDPSEFPQPPPPELILCDPRTGVAAPAVLAAIRQWLEE